MKLRTHLIIVFSVILSVWLLASIRETPRVAARQMDSSPPVPPPSHAEQIRQIAEEQRRADLRKKSLERMEYQLRMHEAAEERAKSLNDDLRRAHNADWRAFVSRNRATFDALWRRAAQAPDHKARCTICDGKGVLSSCVVCSREHPGKCFSCKGTGKLSDGLLCATCGGSGQCYLCYGTGRMFCAFCDDGIIEARSKGPPDLLPVR